jgi:hypothetical protein
MGYLERLFRFAWGKGPGCLRGQKKGHAEVEGDLGGTPQCCYPGTQAEGDLCRFQRVQRTVQYYYRKAAISSQVSC